jgi:hypothetical protein
VRARRKSAGIAPIRGGTRERFAQIGESLTASATP